MSQKPKNYWVNTSGNEIIRQFIGRAGAGTRREIEQLIDGGSIKKVIRQELTYRDLDAGSDHLWSLLFMTGYLTQCGEEEEDGLTPLVIPNREIRWIYVEQVRRWFQEETARDTKTLERFCGAFLKNDVTEIETGFQRYLRKMISIRDTNVRKDRKEHFYHGILLGLFANMDNWVIWSNAESGEGYCDIRVETQDGETGFVIELKYAENAALEEACGRALRQIRDRNDVEALMDDGVKTIYGYGIACYKKRCKVVSSVFPSGSATS